jgi:predicted ester cyclase
MSESLLHKWFAAGDAGNLDALDQYLHTDLLVHSPRGLPTTALKQETTTLEEEKEVWRAARAAMPDLRHAVQEVVSGGSSSAARVRVTGALVGDFAGLSGHGQRFEFDQAIFAHIRDGKVDEAWEIVDTATLLRQAGVISA